MTNTHLHLETIKTSQGRGWGFCANSTWPRAFIPGHEAGLQQCTQVDVKSTGLHLSNYFLHELCGTYTKMRSAGTCFSNKSLRFKHCSHKQRGEGWVGREAQAGKRQRRASSITVARNKNLEGKRVVGPPPNLPHWRQEPIC